MRVQLNCIRCGKPYELEISESLYKRGKYRKHCSRSCANIRHFTDETNKKRRESVIRFQKGHPDLIHHKIYVCNECGKQFTTQTNEGGRKYCSSYCRNAFMRRHIYDNAGGYRIGSGRGKQGRYKGIHCDSSWELAFLVYNMDHNIPIQRCTDPITYNFEGKSHKYYPDFNVNGQLIEIKGYKTKQWEAKLSAAKNKIITLYIQDIQIYLQYVRNKYGKNWIQDLYNQG